MSQSFTALPSEVIHRILFFIGSSSLSDLSTISQTCHLFHLRVYSDEDNALWREIHNSLYDDPRTRSHRPLISMLSTMQAQAQVKEVDVSHSSNSDDGMDLGMASSPPTTITIELDWRQECIDRWRVRRMLIKKKENKERRKRKEGVDKGKDRERGDFDPDQADFISSTLLSMYNTIPLSTTTNATFSSSSSSSSSTSLNLHHLNHLLSFSSFLSLYYSSFRRSSRYSLRPRTRGRGWELPHYGMAHLHALLGGGDWWSGDGMEMGMEMGLGMRDVLEEEESEDEISDDVEFGKVDNDDDGDDDLGISSPPTTRLNYFEILGHNRRITYSITNYSLINDYGPFHPTGSVNWAILDSIATTMDANLAFVSGRGRGEEWMLVPFVDRRGLKAVVASEIGGRKEVKVDEDGNGNEEGKEKEKEKKKEKEGVVDWAGVTGDWRGTYAFMDYTDWIQFNYTDLNILESRPSIDITHYCEAIGKALRMELTTNMSTFAKSLPKIRPTIPISTVVPPLEFCGVSTAGSSIEGSHIRGVVSLTTDDPPETRWTWVVRYSGFDRWRLEGVQIGGCKSRRGIVGIWSDVERADLSPVGPFTYWFVEKEEVEERERLVAELASRRAAAGPSMTWGNPHVIVEEEDDDDDEFMEEDVALSEEGDSGLEEEENPVLPNMWM